MKHQPFNHVYIHIFSAVNCDDATFLLHCCRLARVVHRTRPAPQPEVARWRWTGFAFGMDVVVSVNGRAVSIKRNHRGDKERMLSLKVDWNVWAR